ncbi:MAG: zinc-ribbon domain-containing protein [Desulfobacterales bacterium]|nr:zinc-ribbon domain-containing protein [Desulfobacterales bacterium]
MIITCEECSTRFNLDESLLRPEGSKVRCSQCKHVFTAFPETSETPVPPPESDLDSDPKPDQQSDQEAESFEFDAPEDESNDEEDEGIGAIPSIEDADDAEPEDDEEADLSEDLDISFDEEDDDLGIEISPDTTLEPEEAELDSDEFDAQDIEFDDIEFDEPEPEVEESIPEPEEDTSTESDDLDLSFEESEISFDEDEISFEADDFDADDFEKDGQDELEPALEETTDIDDTEEISFDGTPLEMEAAEDTVFEEIPEEPDLDVPTLEMEDSGDEAEALDFETGDFETEEFETPEFEEPEFDVPEDIEFESDTFEMDDSELPAPEFDESVSPSDADDAETADIEISFDDELDDELDDESDDEDDMSDLADISLEEGDTGSGDGIDDEIPQLDAGELDFEESGIEFEENDLPLDAVDDEDRDVLNDIDFEGLPPEEEESDIPFEPLEDSTASPADEPNAGLEEAAEDIPDLELSFDETADADLVFEEDFAADDLPDLPDLDIDSAEELPALGPDAGLTDADLSFDESDIDGSSPAATDTLPAFEEDNAEFQASLDAELGAETDKFSGYDDVLNQSVEPESGQPDFDSELGDGPDAAPIAPEVPPAPPADNAATAPEVPTPEIPDSGSPVIDPLPDEDIRKKRAKKKKSAIGAPVKVLFLLFVLVIAAYVASLQFGFTIPFLSDLKIPYLTELIKPEPPPKPPLKPAPNEVSIKGKFLTNATAGEIFIVTGKVDNPSKIVYSQIRVKGTLITKENPKAMTQTIYCGNIISEEELKSGNISDIQQKLNVKAGMQNSNMNVGPGKSVRFMLVFSNLPENLTNFTVEVLDFKNSAGKK